jgi:hypothetical protein
MRRGSPANIGQANAMERLTAFHAQLEVTEIVFENMPG